MSDVSKISDHPDYDWALCALHREQLDQTQMHLTNNVHLPNGNILYPKRIYLDDPKDGDVWVNTGNSGVVKGFVMGDYSLLHFLAEDHSKECGWSFWNVMLVWLAVLKVSPPILTK